MSTSFLSKLKNKRSHMRLVEKEMKQIRQLIESQVTQFTPAARPYIEHICKSQGKMLRPGLVLLTAAATGGIKPDHQKFAAILEMLHVASLVHDDVLDKADTRRDIPTANALWGNNMAVLLGDALLSQAMLMGSELHDHNFGASMALVVRDLCQGEIEQSSRLWDVNMTREDYFRLIRMKTATLFAAAMEGAARIQGMEEADLKKFYHIGILIGTSYQIYDDCLDISGMDSAAGKTLGTDTEKGKLTLPIFFLMQSEDSSVATYVLESIASQRAIDFDCLRSTDVFAHAVNQSIEEGTKRNQEALYLLSDLEESPARQALEELIGRLDEMLRAQAIR